ncbi:hypothetical protein LRP50_12345 [Enterovibrio sp. ZSDZ42]|uniref:Uncharacterized protein n=1 Tax=Enterovibrio gelatinilyticus TaxID=2899819 RepID=A0ABT5R0X3_9GAMM|nr:hypothetical protein [Enterovibrio sp. ZSDZ42]MDD1793925.1 hypothetical protein [Enterovibrio sp. ZSDZ42]
MDIPKALLTKTQRFFYKATSYSLAPAILSPFAFGYIGIPGDIQIMIRRLVIPESQRAKALEIFSLEQWFLGLFIIAVVTMLWGTFGLGYRHYLLKRIIALTDKENFELKQRLNSNTVDYYEFFSRFIFNSYYSALQLTSNERISLYRLDMDHFLCVGRYSDNEIYKQKPSRLYPKNQGCISRAWQIGSSQHVSKFCPESEIDQWVAEHVSDFGFEESTLREMTMKSRSLKCIRIQDANNNNIAVIAFESVNQDGLPIGKIERKMNERERKSLCHLLEALESHIPSLQNASSEGF